MSREPDKRDEPTALARKLRLLPSSPGVYLHKDKNDKIIYVGKAVNLRSRVRSYFANNVDSIKTDRLRHQIADIEIITTDSELEALLLENTLIKKHQPHYNIRLKDDRQFPYIKVNWQEEFPRIEVVRRMAPDGARYFGPFTDVGAMRETLKFAAGFFQVRTCSLDLPDPSVDRPCLDHQIGRCTAPCVGLVTAEAYAGDVRDTVMFLEGRSSAVIEGLVKNMEQALSVEQHVRGAIRIDISLATRDCQSSRFHCRKQCQPRLQGTALVQRQRHLDHQSIRALPVQNI